jgi:hypothetical protein
VIWDFGFGISDLKNGEGRAAGAAGKAVVSFECWVLGCGTTFSKGAQRPVSAGGSRPTADPHRPNGRKDAAATAARPKSSFKSQIPNPKSQITSLLPRINPTPSSKSQIPNPKSQITSLLPWINRYAPQTV